MKTESAKLDSPPFWFAAERLPLFSEVYPEQKIDSPKILQDLAATKTCEPGRSVAELVRGRMEMCRTGDSESLGGFFPFASFGNRAGIAGAGS